MRLGAHQGWHVYIQREAYKHGGYYWGAKVMHGNVGWGSSHSDTWLGAIREATFMYYLFALDIYLEDPLEPYSSNPTALG